MEKHKLQKVASAEVRSLLLDGYRLVFECKITGSYYLLRHPNGSRMSVHVRNDKVIICKNGLQVKTV